MAPRDRVWTRRQIEAQIAAGRKLIILDGQVIKADAWLPFHPGGEKAILHMVGRDATDEIRALHSPEAQQQMLKFVAGRVEGQWENMLPPIQGGVFRKEGEDERKASTSDDSSSLPPSPIFDAVQVDGPRQRHRDNASSRTSLASLSDSVPTTKETTRFTNNASDDLSNYPSLDSVAQGKVISAYRDLDVQLRAAGLYNCPYWAYGIESLRYATLFISSMYCLHIGQYLLSGCLLGLFWHQLVFTAHDAGHMGITHNFHVDTCIGIFIADFLGGLSIGWWKRNHNVHHIVTNSPEHDPDIEHMPFFAISSRFFEGLRSTYYDRVMSFDAAAQLAIKYQHLLYYPLLALGRFNLYRLSWEYLLSSQPPSKGPAWWHRWLELFGQCVFWYWYGYLVLYRTIPTASARLVFILVSHIITGPLHVQITLSHFAMSTADLGPRESFPQRMLRTTMDVHCPPWMDFIHGGLQFQAIHHLFPRIPRHNLRQAKPYVEKFCDEVGVPYVCFDFVSGNREVLGRLEEVARQVEVFEAARNAAAQDLIHGHSH
ncbi:hypothetical protein DV737_g843, partial [Chaetothyriales sp. CBS 132003]